MESIAVLLHTASRGKPWLAEYRFPRTTSSDPVYSRSPRRNIVSISRPHERNENVDSDSVIFTVFHQIAASPRRVLSLGFFFSIHCWRFLVSQQHHHQDAIIISIRATANDQKSVHLVSCGAENDFIKQSDGRKTGNMMRSSRPEEEDGDADDHRSTGKDARALGDAEENRGESWRE